MQTPPEHPLEPALTRRRRERAELIDCADSYVDRVDAARPGLHAAVVYGSVARGDFNKWSDIDLLLVVDRAAERQLDRFDDLPPWPGRVQPLVWTAAEWQRALDRGNPIAVESVERGIWLRGNPQALRAT